MKRPPKRTPPHPTVRDMRFGFDAGLPKYWYGDDPAITALLNALSMLFPEGERFFVRSVKHFAATITEPHVVAPVKAFMGQEGAHSREHAAMNNLIAAQWGPAAKRWENWAAATMRRGERYLSAHRRLAITCALEHLTAIFAHIALSDPKTLAPADPHYAALLRWHAREELEHKAVAFDVYQTAVGSYLERTSTLVTETLLFLVFAHLIAYKLLRSDEQPLASSGLRIAKFLLVTPGIVRKVAVPWLTYFSPRFHPWNRDNRHLLESFE